MRLIDTYTGEFVNFVDLERIPPYAILSHTWDKDGEQSYQDVVKIQEKYRNHWSLFLFLTEAFSDPRLDDPEVLVASDLCPHAQCTLRSSSIFWGLLLLWWTLLVPIMRAWFSRVRTLISLARGSILDPDSGLSEKVRRACEIARRDGYHYIWIDSCCIDKTSSSELSEAINSMFNWYRGAQICYAFLADVPSDDDVREYYSSKFCKSRWFTRGWTLQELIAPLVVVFLSEDWEGLGTKDGLADIIERITSIDRGILTHEKAPGDESVANRMQWASQRETTRVEDEAYSLLGIFGITMPSLYGEGQYAFRRLQEAILQRIPDQSLFVWGSEYKDTRMFPSTSWHCMNVDIPDTLTLFAPSPRSFASNGKQIIQLSEDSIESLELPVEEYTHTPYGIRTQLCLVPLYDLDQRFLVNVRASDNVPYSQFRLASHIVDSKFYVHARREDPVPWYLVVLRSRDANDAKHLLGRLCYLRSSKNAKVEFLYLAENLTIYDRNQWGRKCNRWIPTSNSFAIPLDDLARVRKTLGQPQTKTVYIPHHKPSGAKRQLVGDDSTLSLTLPTWAWDVLRVGGYTVSNVQGPTVEHDGTSFSFTLIYATANIHIHYRHILIHHPRYNSDDSPKAACTVAIEARVWILSPGEEPPRTDTPIQLSPPYTTAAWVDHGPGSWAMTLPARSLNLVVGSGDKETTMTLRLGLDLVAPLRYNIRVDVAPYINTEVGAPFRLRLKDMAPKDRRHDNPHKTLKLILPGSARRALETKGYAVDLALHISPGNFCYHCITLSSGVGSDKFAIVVKYLYMLDDGIFQGSVSNPALLISARVTLEVSSCRGGFETVHDGPYVVGWHDRSPWKEVLEKKHVVLTTPTGKSLALHLGLDLAWYSEYYLNVDIEPSTPSLQHQQMSSMMWQEHVEEYAYYLTKWAHKRLSLTLPGHVRRALQAQGYRVRFEGLDARGDPSDPGGHLLTLSHIRAGVTITIKYSHHLTTYHPEPDSDGSADSFEGNYPLFLVDSQPDPGSVAKRCQQELSFQVSVQTLLDTPSRVAVQGGETRTTALMDWVAKDRQWEWDLRLPGKDITLTLPTGHQLVLRLGFTLVWHSEYWLIVKINPRKPLSDTRFASSPDRPPMPEYQLDEAGIEYIRQSFAQGTEPGQPADAHDEPTMRITPEGLPVGNEEGAGDEGGHNLDSDDEALPADASTLEGSQV